MAKSKNGGTRSFLRGRIANDVYTIGQDSKGKKQQVVRSLAEQVSNPRTVAQMRGRMYMTTVMQAVSQLAPLIDHSFDGVAAGQPSISEFIRQNYALIKADAIAHPNAGNLFGLVKFGEKGAKGGKYLVSDGKVLKPAIVNAADADKRVMEISLSSAAPTVADVQQALGVAAGDYFTMIIILANGVAAFYRVYFAPSIASDTAISADNVADLFTVAGNVAVAISFTAGEDGSTIAFTPSTAADAISFGIIVSQSRNGGWIHSKTTLENVGSVEFPASVALPTYPVGEQRFLNGGDTDGSIESGSGEEGAVILSGSFGTLTVDGQSAIGAVPPLAFSSAGSKTIAGTINGAMSDKTYTVNEVAYNDTTGTGNVVATVTNGTISGSLNVTANTQSVLILVCEGQRLDTSNQIYFDAD